MVVRGEMCCDIKCLRDVAWNMRYNHVMWNVVQWWCDVEWCDVKGGVSGVKSFGVM